MTTKTLTTPPAGPGVPPLRDGERLTVGEFRRRYEAMPDHIKAELINGVVYMSSAVSTDFHGDPHADLIGWLAHYRAYTPGVRVSDNASVRELEGEHEPQPDASLRLLQQFGGRTRTNADGYMERAPELAAEVAASNVRLALGDKLEMYRSNGTQEYIVWRVHDAAIDWFVLRGARYEALPLPPSGIYRSEVFPGLWLDAEALIHGDMARVLRVLQEGLASAEHAAFVKRLQDAAAQVSSQ
jgi:Uma2 family endonuclease